MDNDLVELLRDEEDASLTIAALVTSATHDENPRHSLSQIYQALCQGSPFMDPLNMLPLLLPCKEEAARDILALLGQCSSAKEIVIGVQEAFERLDILLHSEDSDDDEAQRPMGEQLLILVQLYEAAIPRLKLRKKTVSETIRPLLADMQSTLETSSHRISRDLGREIIIAVSTLAQALAAWANDQPDVEEAELSVTREILKALLDATITAYSSCIQASVAQRTLQQCFPRLGPRVVPAKDWEAGADAISKALETYSALNWNVQILRKMPSTIDMILLAHAKASLDPPRLLEFMLPLFLASIQANSALDECLSLLLQALYRTQVDSLNLSPEVIIPLSTLLPSLASGHPDPSVRFQTFRALSLLLSATPSPLRLQILKELVSDAELLQMRSAAIGLVKEAVLDAIPVDPTRPSIFATPQFLQILGPVLFRANPPDFFSSALSLDELKESPEPARLTESLALYYTLLIRDKGNSTGVRDRDSIANVEKSLLGPLRSTLTKWLADPSIEKDHIHAIMPLVSLKTGLERVDDAVAQIAS
ncbi:hypothetical protein C8J56DRAFT_288592 [Mycena floridula]|nr:hypothetical protein C8J56DRAFT_288592 [Mycena floridula]